MNGNNIDLTKILRDCPQGETFWSPMLGDVKYYGIDVVNELVGVNVASGEMWDINADGTITINGVTSPEIMIYPSKEQRDWTKVKYEPKKERFDPTTMKPFDRVLVRVSNLKWKADFFSHEGDDKVYPYICAGNLYKYCIPYNDDTKHLVGTKDEAPEFYRYWED